MYRVLVTLDLPASVLARLTASCEVTRVAGGLGLVASVAAVTREQGGHQLLPDPGGCHQLGAVLKAADCHLAVLHCLLHQPWAPSLHSS